MRIQQLDLWNFKAFERFTMTLGTSAFLGGTQQRWEINPHFGRKSRGWNAGARDSEKAGWTSTTRPPACDDTFAPRGSVRPGDGEPQTSVPFCRVGSVASYGHRSDSRRSMAL